MKFKKTQGWLFIGTTASIVAPLIATVSCSNTIVREKRALGISSELIDKFKFGNSSSLSLAYLASAAERRAGLKTIFKMAETLVDDAIKANGHNLDTTHRAVAMQKPIIGDYFGLEKTKKEIPAVVVDLDETFLDNTPFQVFSMLENIGYNHDNWRKWIDSGQSSLYPGVIEFVNHVYDSGGVVIFTSNRDQIHERAGTKKSLKTFNFPNKYNTDINYWMKGVEKDDPGNPNADVAGNKIANFLKETYHLSREEAEKAATLKEARYQYINDKTNYQIIMVVGDNLDDFNDFASQGTLNEKRNNIASTDLKDLWGDIDNEIRYNPKTNQKVKLSAKMFDHDAKVFKPGKISYVLIGGNSGYGSWESGLKQGYNALSLKEKIKARYDGTHPSWMPTWNGESTFKKIEELNDIYKKFISY